jgi:restriction system protein
LCVTIPDYQSLMAPALDALADNHEHSMSELRASLADKIGLTEEDLRVKIPSGAPLFASRLHWAVTYMYQSGLVRRPRRGVVEITPRGLDVLNKHPNRVDLSVLGQFAEFNDFRNRTRRAEQAAAAPEGVAEAPPRETVAAAVAEANVAVSEEVLERVREREPAFLERLVLDLLRAMGYAGATGSAEHTGKPGDKGLDGVISQDALGLDRIYVQAKRYAAETPVRRPEIQEFVGALHGAQADRGIFVTTSRFTSDAEDYAERVAARLILIDGRALGDLMVKYNVGVQDREIYVIKRIDEDFFEDSG